MPDLGLVESDEGGWGRVRVRPRWTGVTVGIRLALSLTGHVLATRRPCTISFAVYRSRSITYVDVLRQW